MSEKVNCDHCGIELRKDSLRRHIKTKHQKEELSWVCLLTSKTQSSWCPRKNKYQCYPLHVQKKTKKKKNAQWHWPFCESNFCMNYMSMCTKSGLKTELRRHLRQVVATNTSFPEPIVLLDAILDSLGPNDDSVDNFFKAKTIEKCKELNSTSLKIILHLESVWTLQIWHTCQFYHDKKHHAARLKRFLVTFTKETCLRDFGRCDRKINCIQKVMAMWFLKQTEQLSRPWSQTIGVNQTDNRELMTKNCESLFYPSVDEELLLQTIKVFA